MTYFHKIQIEGKTSKQAKENKILFHSCKVDGLTQQFNTEWFPEVSPQIWLKMFFVYGQCVTGKINYAK